MKKNYIAYKLNKEFKVTVNIVNMHQLCSINNSEPYQDLFFSTHQEMTAVKTLTELCS